ncbi:hypothetical protein QUF80_16840 [Desulfococcaceae bacterium HSG8]|nr:hypothetical protein [Desulfococcaceae bacterium HSG8]
MTRIKNNPTVAVVLAVVMTLSLVFTDVSAQTTVPVDPADETKGHVTLNPGYIRGTVSIGDVSNNTVTAYKTRVSAKSKDATGNELYSEIWIESDLWEAQEYELTVHIPDETRKAGETQEYTVSCKVFYSDASNGSLKDNPYIVFENQSANVTFQGTANVNFDLNPGYVNGRLETNCDLDYGWVYLKPDGASYYYTRIRFGADGEFHFPVRPDVNSIVWGTAVMTNGWVYDLAEQAVTVAEGGTENREWTISCTSGCSGSISGSIHLYGLGTNTVDEHHIFVKGATETQTSTDGDT